MIHTAIVKNQYSTIAIVSQIPWSKLTANLSQPDGTKKVGSGWMPVSAEKGPRTKDRITTVDALVLDVEADKDGGKEPPSVEHMLGKLRKLGFQSFLHTTFSHTEEHPRYRLVFEISRPMEPDELRPVGLAVARSVGIEDSFDKGALEPARLYFLPRCPKDRKALFRSESVEGVALQIDLLLDPNKTVPEVVDLDPKLIEWNDNLLGRTWPEKEANVEEARKLLEQCSPDCPYPIWRNIIWSVCSLGWDIGPKLVTDWSKTSKIHWLTPKKAQAAQGFLDAIISSYDSSKPVSIGTLIFHAKSHGDKREAQTQSDVASEERPRFTFQTPAELRSKPTEPWRVKKLLPERGLVAIYGASGSGKSFYALDLLAKVATGLDFYGRKVQSCPVVYVALEGAGGFTKRVQAWEKHHGTKLPDDFRVVTDSLSLFDENPAEFADAVNAEGLGGGIITIDTLNRSAPSADENTSRDMGTIISHASVLGELTRSLVILIHHVGKNETSGLRGHSSLRAALETSIEVKNKAGGREWCVDKAKDEEDGVSLPFKLEMVSLGTDEDGDEITSCVAATDLFRKITPAPPTGKNQRVVLDEIAGHLGQDGSITPDEAIQLGVDALDGQDPKRRRERTKQAIAGLISNGNIVESDEGYRLG